MGCVMRSIPRIVDMTKTSETILTVRNLKVDFTTPDGTVNAVKGIDLDVKPGKRSPLSANPVPAKARP